ncbi:MAG: MBL fold metallo-hydrolase [Desulfamplus sp.]|nr:MBL fold metallo-hydrolase [Desulfamplus sp.]
MITIKVLIENRKPDNRNNLETEHGLALHIEHKNQRILFDTGASEAFGRNAQKLGIDIDQVDMAIISHHHYDHGGGLPFFLENNVKSKVYLGKQPSGDVLFKAWAGLLKKHIGLNKQVFAKYPDRFLFLNDMAEIAPDIFIITNICNKYKRPKGNNKLLIQKNGVLRPDKFEHEIIVVLKDKEELVVLTGCSHNGILNMIETVTHNFPNIPIKAVVGGFHLAGIPIEHLMPESRQEIEEIGYQLLKYPIKKVYTGHCTGLKSYKILKRVMGNKLEYITTGAFIDI